MYESKILLYEAKTLFYRLKILLKKTKIPKENSERILSRNHFSKNDSKTQIFHLQLSKILFHKVETN